MDLQFWVADHDGTLAAAACELDAVGSWVEREGLVVHVAGLLGMRPSISGSNMVSYSTWSDKFLSNEGIPDTLA